MGGHAALWAPQQHSHGSSICSRHYAHPDRLYIRPLTLGCLLASLQFQCIGRGASKVVYKGFDEVEGIEVAWNEVACSDWVLGR